MAKTIIDKSIASCCCGCCGCVKYRTHHERKQKLLLETNSGSTLLIDRSVNKSSISLICVIIFISRFVDFGLAYCNNSITTSFFVLRFLGSSSGRERAGQSINKLYDTYVSVVRINNLSSPGALITCTYATFPLSF
jgi:hypothetical protein